MNEHFANLAQLDPPTVGVTFFYLALGVAALWLLSKLWAMKIVRFLVVGIVLLVLITAAMRPAQTHQWLMSEANKLWPADAEPPPRATYTGNSF